MLYPFLSIFLVSFYSTTATFAQTEAIPSLETPFEGIDVPFEQFPHNVQSCGTYVSASGTAICVPPDAFVDKSGNVIQGDVLILFRDFHSPMDILLSGIPMEYRVNGKAYQLESAGMFEIWAIYQGALAGIAPTQEIQINSPSYRDLENVEFFQFDWSKKRWDKEINLFSSTPAKPLVEVSDEGGDVWGEFEGSNNDDWNDDWNGDWDGEWMEGDWTAEDTAWHEISKFAEQVRNAVGISEFGLYNYDRILKMDERVQIIANFDMGVDLKEVLAVQVYVVYEDINTVYSFPQYDWKERFYLLDGHNAKMFAILPDNKLSVFPRYELESMDLQSLDGQAFTFLMEKAQEAESADAIKNLLNIY